MNLKESKSKGVNREVSPFLAGPVGLARLHRIIVVSSIFAGTMVGSPEKHPQRAVDAVGYLRDQAAEVISPTPEELEMLQKKVVSKMSGDEAGQQEMADEMIMLLERQGYVIDSDRLDGIMGHPTFQDGRILIDDREYELLVASVDVKGGNRVNYFSGLRQKDGANQRISLSAAYALDTDRDEDGRGDAEMIVRTKDGLREIIEKKSSRTEMANDGQRHP